MEAHEGSSTGAGPAPQQLRPSPGRWRVGLAALGAVGLAVLASLWSQPPAEAFTLDVQSVPLNPSDPAQAEAGPLVFRGGLWLRSEDPEFGGLSALRVSADGARLMAVSDCGRAFGATLTYDAGGRLSGVKDATLRALAGPGGRSLERPELDAEGLAADGPDRVMVAFEGRPPRIWSYRLDPPLAGFPVARAGPPFDDDCQRNAGPEAIAARPDGGVVVLCEGGGLRPSSTTAWLRHGADWSSRSYPLASDEPGLHDVYRPTGATFLPDGDLLVLERRYPPLAVRLMKLSAADLAGTGPLNPREIVRLDPPLNLDNFEGVATRRDASGATLLYLISDDNGCSKGSTVVAPRVQRTLLLLFELLPG